MYKSPVKINNARVFYVVAKDEITDKSIGLSN